MQVIDKDQEFNKWFHENEVTGLRSDRLMDGLEVSDSKVALYSNVELLLKCAFEAGMRTAAQDSCDTLRDYATFLAGIDTPLRTLTESYDNSAQSLMLYWTSVF